MCDWLSKDHVCCRLGDTICFEGAQRTHNQSDMASGKNAGCDECIDQASRACVAKLGKTTVVMLRVEVMAKCTPHA